MIETPEERRARIDEHIKRVGVARDAIVAVVGKKRGVAGTIPCPCCDGGVRRYSVSSYNGHIWSTCSTKECVGWME